MKSVKHIVLHFQQIPHHLIFGCYFHDFCVFECVGVCVGTLGFCILLFFFASHSSTFLQIYFYWSSHLRCSHFLFIEYILMGRAIVFYFISISARHHDFQPFHLMKVALTLLSDSFLFLFFFLFFFLNCKWVKLCVFLCVWWFSIWHSAYFGTE